VHARKKSIIDFSMSKDKQDKNNDPIFKIKKGVDLNQRPALKYLRRPQFL